MSRISAANNLTIETGQDRWSLLVNGDGTERLLVEAAIGQPVRYVPAFGHRRRLSDTGLLPLIYIQRVVLGWSMQDEAWHLGLILEPEAAEPRGSRWCEVAHWPDPERDLYLDLAREAGVSLAQAVERPFNVIPPRDELEITPVELPTLPVTLEQWQVEEPTPGTITLTRAPAWARSKLIRIFWYSLWTVVYVLLSVATLQGVIALPRPEFLPYLGLVSAAVLLLLILNLVHQLLTKPNRFEINAETRTMRALRGNSERWHVSAADLDSVYVSQVVGRKPRRDKRTIHYGELNLLRKDGSFGYVLENGQAEEKNVAFDGLPAEEKTVPLTPELVETSLQTAAAHIGKALDLPVWYDQRVK